MTDGRYVYCDQCGRAGTPRGLSLDGATPLVLCRWTDQRGKERGHGLTIGTYDGRGVLERIEAARLARIAAAHPNHRTALGVHRECQACLARGPHLDHILARKAKPGCPDCDTARVRVAAWHVGS